MQQSYQDTASGSSYGMTQCDSTTVGVQLLIYINTKLFTYCNIKEDAFDIYGFSTREELDCFRRLIGVTGVGMLALAWLLARIVRHPLGVWSLTAVIGGGVGNLIDRVRLGYVVDMLDCTFIEFPVFNVADCFVVCGTIAALVYYIWIYPNTDAKNWEKDHGTDPAQGK